MGGWKQQQRKSIYINNLKLSDVNKEDETTTSTPQRSCRCVKKMKQQHLLTKKLSMCKEDETTTSTHKEVVDV